MLTSSEPEYEKEEPVLEVEQRRFRRSARKGVEIVEVLVLNEVE